MKLTPYNSACGVGKLGTRQSGFANLFREFDQFFTPFNDSAVPALSAEGGIGTWSSDQDENNYYVRVEAPALNRNDLKVSITDKVLTVKGTKKTWKQGSEDTENSVSFEQNFRVPRTVVGDKITAVYEDGVLTLTLPKAEEVKPKEVAIEVK